MEKVHFVDERDEGRETIPDQVLRAGLGGDALTDREDPLSASFGPPNPENEQRAAPQF